MVEKPVSMEGVNEIYNFSPVMDILPKALKKCNISCIMVWKSKAHESRKGWILLDYITSNKEGIGADTTLNILHIDMLLKEL